MECKVSIVIPVYNMERYLDRCLESVINQSYENLEIILVNDGSTDTSGALCSGYASENPKIRVIHQQNRGVSAARNAGIREASGAYILFVDADDEIFPDAVENLVKAAVEKDADAVVGGLCHVRKDGQIKTEDRTQIQQMLTGCEFLEAILKDHPVGYYSWRILFRRELIADIAFPEGRTVGEDSYFVFCCALRKPKVYILDLPVYKYHDNAASATRVSFTEKKCGDILHLLDCKRNIVTKQFPEYGDLMNNLTLKIYMMLLTNLCCVNGRDWSKKEKMLLKEFYKLKRYFIPATEKNKQWFRILSLHLYHPYKIAVCIKRKLRKLRR